MNALFAMLPEIQRLKGELAAVGLVVNQLVQSLNELTAKDEKLNRHLTAALAQKQNPRPLYLATSDLLLERARVSTELSVNTAKSADLTHQLAEIVEQIINPSLEQGGAK